MRTYDPNTHLDDYCCYAEVARAEASSEVDFHLHIDCKCRLVERRDPAGRSLRRSTSLFSSAAHRHDQARSRASRRQFASQPSPVAGHVCPVGGSAG